LFSLKRVATVTNMRIYPWINKNGEFCRFLRELLLPKELCAPESYCTERPTLFCESKRPSSQE
jgi:hypothetical protein